ncbi:MAG TPA: right-handed parallel beta-helix repeat-containing protein [Streptosporangiaceae bacterium]
MTSGDHGSAARGRVFPVLLGALAFFGVLSTLPITLPLLHLQRHPLAYPSAPTTRYGVTLTVAPRTPRPVQLPAVARPIEPGLAPATPPAVNADSEVAAVRTEDRRLRTMLHRSVHVYQPRVIRLRGSRPTLLLTGPQPTYSPRRALMLPPSQSTYTAATLVQDRALVMLPNHAALLKKSVFITANASLTLGDPSLQTLYLDSGSGGLTSIVAWDGNLTFAGTSSHPLTIMGWDSSTNSPAVDQGYGRPYIRELGGRMTLTDVRVSSLGFWSGRTGGVAWTGVTGKPSTGGATSSTFTDDTYGAFVSRGLGVTFKGDLFESNQLDGLHIHRYSVNSAVVSSSAARNGGNGFFASPATQSTHFDGDVAVRNARNGFLINGRPLATGASASGGSVSPGTGTTVENSASLNNGKMGILVEGGLGTVLKGDQVCDGLTAVSVRYGATDTVVTGNSIWCHPGSGISVGPSAPGTVLSGNSVDGARTAFLIRNSGPVQVYKNVVTHATVFGISARWASSSVTGVGNTFSGTGFRAVDHRALAPKPVLYATNTADWTYHAKVTFWTYLQFHPLAAMWLGILVIVLAFALTRMRRKPAHPYPHSTRWRGEVTPAEAVTAADEVQLAARAGRPAYDSPVTAAYRPGPPIAASGSTAGPAIDLMPSGRRPMPANPGSLTGPENPPSNPGRHGRRDPIPAFDSPAYGAQPPGPGNSARDWPTAPDGRAKLTGAGPGGPGRPGGVSGPGGPGGVSGPGGPGGVSGPADQGSESWVPRWLDSGMYREANGHGGTAPGRPAHGGRQDDAARPPWPAAPTPKRDSESRYRDQFDPHGPRPGEVDRR